MAELTGLLQGPSWQPQRGFTGFGIPASTAVCWHGGPTRQDRLRGDPQETAHFSPVPLNRQTGFDFTFGHKCEHWLMEPAVGRSLIRIRNEGHTEARLVARLWGGVVAGPSASHNPKILSGRFTMQAAAHAVQHKESEKVANTCMATPGIIRWL